MGLFGSRKKCYCAFCKSERMVYSKRRINVFNVLAAAVAAGLTMAVIWQAFDPRVMLFFVAFLAIAESFVQIRWRLNIVCKYCGFDPVLYLKDPEKVAQRVRLVLEDRKKDPATLFKAPLKIPFLKKKPEQSPLKPANPKGKIVSKEA